jgi:hypothetical protein
MALRATEVRQAARRRVTVSAPAPTRSNQSLGAGPVAPACKWADDKENGAVASAAWESQLQTAGPASERANLAQTLVYVRVRPLQPRGTAGDSQRALCIEASGADGLQTLVLSSGLCNDVASNAESRYSFHRAFESEGHEELADTIGSPLVASVLNGYNGTERWRFPRAARVCTTCVNLGREAAEADLLPFPRASAAQARC